jgi:catecholate siderophore receptor
LRDTPQTISIVPRAVIEEQGAQSLTDVLRNVPGLTVAAGEGGAPAGDNLTLRGFNARNDIFVDGVRDIGAQSRDSFNMEQVEVVKGPQSAMTGRGSSGGSINLVSKTPAVSRFFNGSFQFGTYKLARGTADVNVPLNDRTAFRLNVLGHKSGVPGRNVVDSNRWGFAPSLAFGLGTPTRLTLNYYKLKQDNISDFGIPWVPNTHNVLEAYRDQPAPAPRDTFYGFKDRDKEKLDADLGTVRVEHDLNDGVTLRNQFRFGQTSRDSIASPPRFDSPDTTVIRRNMRAWLNDDTVADNQTDITARFATGVVRHSVVAGTAFTRENNTRTNRSAPHSLTTLLNPDPNDIYEDVITVSPVVGDLTGDTQAVYAFDTLSFGRYVQVTGGVRGERFAADGLTNTGVPIDTVSKMLSTRAGLVFRPVSIGSLYVSYGTSFNPAFEGLGFVSGDNDPNLDPEKTYTTEVGSKWDLVNGRLLLAGALFNVAKTNARTPGLLPGDPPQVLDGRQRVRGAELSATGNITPAWTVFSAYTLLDSRVVESNNPEQIGNRFPQTPKHAFSSWTTYAFPWRVTLGGGLRYVGRRYNNINNARSVDGYWMVDAMAQVPVRDWLDIRANLTNAANVYYFERVGGGHVIPGASRALMISTNLRF